MPEVDVQSLLTLLGPTGGGLATAVLIVWRVARQACRRYESMEKRVSDMMSRHESERETERQRQAARDRQYDDLTRRIDALNQHLIAHMDKHS